MTVLHAACCLRAPTNGDIRRPMGCPVVVHLPLPPLLSCALQTLVCDVSFFSCRTSFCPRGCGAGTRDKGTVKGHRCLYRPWTHLRPFHLSGAKASAVAVMSMLSLDTRMSSRLFAVRRAMHALLLQLTNNQGLPQL